MDWNKAGLANDFLGLKVGWGVLGDDCECLEIPREQEFHHFISI